MRRIVDMPKGGGIGRDGDIWFEILDDLSRTHEYRLGVEDIASFIAGLERFSNEAQALKSGEADSRALTARTIECFSGPDGGLQISIGLASNSSLRFDIPTERIKPLLTQMVRAIQRLNSDP
jgi:hypothetical protein